MKIIVSLFMTAVVGLGLAANLRAADITFNTNGSTAWVTPANWSGGVLPGENDVAAFGTMPTAGATTGVGILMQSPNLPAPGDVRIGAIQVLGTRTANLLLGNSSTSTDGTLTFYGATVNGVANTILSHESSGAFNIQKNTGTGTRNFTARLFADTNYAIQVNGAGDVAVAISITGSGGITTQGTGSGRTIFSGTNTYSGGTTVSAGTLLINNPGGSGTGTGAVAVNGTLGGTGFIAPTGTNGISVASGGFLTPGSDGIGTLTLNLGGTTGAVNFASGGGFKFELGAANASIGGIAAGSSDLLAIAGTSAGDVAFGGNTIDFSGSATGTGYYKLFATSLDETTWIGLTLGDSVTGGRLITGGLAVSNLAEGDFTGNLILGNGSAGTSAGDIYLQVVPEPGTLALLAVGAACMFFRARRQRARRQCS